MIRHTVGGLPPTVCLFFLSKIQAICTMFSKFYKLNPLYWLLSKKVDRYFADLLSSIFCIGTSKLSQANIVLIRQHILSNYLFTHNGSMRRLFRVLKCRGISLILSTENPKLLKVTIQRGEDRFEMNCHGFEKFFLKPSSESVTDILIAELTELNKLSTSGIIFSSLETRTVSEYLSTMASVFDRNKDIPVKKKYEERLNAFISAGIKPATNTNNWHINTCGTVINIQLYIKK